MKVFSIEDVMQTYLLTKEVFENAFSTTLPSIDPARVEKLSGIIRSVHMSFAGKPLYPGTARKAATLFYMIIKNHPLVDGNKRMAVITLHAFLLFRGKKLYVDPISMYEWAIRVAESHPKEKDKIMGYMERQLKRAFKYESRYEGVTLGSEYFYYLRGV